MEDECKTHVGDSRMTSVCPSPSQHSQPASHLIVHAPPPGATEAVRAEGEQPFAWWTLAMYRTLAELEPSKTTKKTVTLLEKIS